MHPKKKRNLEIDWMGTDQKENRERERNNKGKDESELGQKK